MGAAIDGTAIDKVLRDAVDSGGVPHVAAIAASRDGVIYQGSAGPRAAGESDPVTVDTLFRIMSMTKMPCTVAALQQVEQGHLDLDFPADLPTADPGSSCAFRASPGYKWGYGLLLNTADIPGMRRAWSGAWAGLCNTQFWVDRTSGVCASIYSNFLPFVTPEAVTLYNDFERALYASL
jgi:CubicO group peptidase (beta-lactamase class C family)